MIYLTAGTLPNVKGLLPTSAPPHPALTDHMFRPVIDQVQARDSSCVQTTDLYIAVLSQRYRNIAAWLQFCAYPI